MDHAASPARETGFSSRSKWAFAVFMLVAAFFLWTEHRAHLLGILPYLLFAACPLVHLFHHGGSSSVSQDRNRDHKAQEEP